MALSDYSTTRDSNAAIAPGNIRAANFSEQQIVNSIRQIMADLASFQVASTFGDGSVGAPSISFTNDPDTGFYRFNSDVLAFASGGIEAMRFGQSGGANGCIELGRQDGTASTPFIDFHAGATATDFDARIICTTGTGTSAGGVLEVRGTPISITQGQVKFPATQNASSDVNILDDYEEGTFTPAIFGSATAGTGTYTKQTGHYCKIGRTVFINLQIIWTAHTGTGSMKVSGLPFTVENNSNNFCFLSSYQNGVLVVGQFAGYTEINTTNLVVVEMPVSGGGATTTVAMDSAGDVGFAGLYRTAN